jgi:hypothetical protein
MASPKPYKRLPGTGYRKTIPPWLILLAFFGIGVFALLLRGRRVQLWEGEEELMLVESNGYVESYKRFNYANIQGFIIRRTNGAKIATFILAAICVCFGALAIAVSDIEGRIALIVIASVFFLLGLVNVLMGQSCETFVRTAVQTDDLPSLDRLPRARKVLNRLKPRIAATQGQLVAEEIPARIRELLPKAAPPVMSAAPTAQLLPVDAAPAASATAPIAASTEPAGAPPVIQ